MVLEPRNSVNVSFSLTPMESIEERIKKPKYNIDVDMVYSFSFFSRNYDIKPNATSGSQPFENGCGELSAKPQP